MRYKLYSPKEFSNVWWFLITLILNVLTLLCSAWPLWFPAAVQEERQRGKEKSDNEVESTSSFNEEMPVDKILDAELAVEPKTETYTESSPGNSVRHIHLVIYNLHNTYLLTLASWKNTWEKKVNYFLSLFLSHLRASLRQMTQSLISAMQLTSNCSLWWSGPREYLISPICLWMIRSFCFEQVCDTHSHRYTTNIHDQDTEVTVYKQVLNWNTLKTTSSVF